MANIQSKYIPGLQATAECGRSVDNLKLLNAGKSEVAFTMVDAAWDAKQGVDKFKDRKFEPRTLMVLYPNRMHVVTVEGTGINKLSDLKGKRVSTGSAGSGTEIMAMRILEAVGIDGHKDIKQERLGVAESVNAIKDRRSTRSSGWAACPPRRSPTSRDAGREDQADRPRRSRRRDEQEVRAAVRQGSIAQRSYQGMDKPNENIDVWNILVASDKMSDKMAVRHREDARTRRSPSSCVHKEAMNIDLKYQKVGSPLPYHPGAKKYFEEQGVKF
jgi:TRAP-type uncharacterized transport system substrate-binding protein